MEFLFNKQKIIYTCTKIQCNKEFFFSLYYFKSLKRSVVYLFSTQKENRNLRSCVKGSVFAWKRTRYVYLSFSFILFFLSILISFYSFLRHFVTLASSPRDFLCNWFSYLFDWETIDVDILREETYVAKPTALLRRGGAQSIDRSTEGDTPPRGDDFAHPPTHVCICNAHTGSREAQWMADRTWIEPAGDRDCLLRSLAGEPACPVSLGGRRVTPPYRVLPLPPFHRRVTYNL